MYLQKEAQYVHGQDITLIGSRSGANAVAVWMILSTYGPYGWKEKINTLLYRTQWVCDQLHELGINFYRHEDLNIVTMNSGQFSKELAEEFNLVPDNHDDPQWFKIVVMDHVTMDLLVEFIETLKSDLLNSKKNDFSAQIDFSNFVSAN